MILTRGTLLSPHFTVDEALVSTPGLQAIPEGYAANVRRAADGMEALREQLQRRAVTPTSWYRDPANNARVGGDADSSHLQGWGVDFTVKGLRPREVMRMLQPHVRALGLDELIEYPSHVHVSFDPRRRAKVLLAVGGGNFTPWTSTEAVQYMASEPGSGDNKRNAQLIALAVAILTAIVTFLKSLGAS